MHNRFSKCRVDGVVSWIARNFYPWLHVDYVEYVSGFDNLANCIDCIVEDSAVVPIAVREETAGKT